VFGVHPLQLASAAKQDAKETIDPSRNIGLEPSNNSTHDTNTMGFTKLQHNVEVTYQLLALFPHRIKTIQDVRMEVQHNC